MTLRKTIVGRRLFAGHVVGSRSMHGREEKMYRSSCTRYISERRQALVKHDYYFYLLYRHECFTGKYTIPKSHKNYLRDSSETSSGLPRKFSAIFGNLRTSSEMFGNVRLAFGTILENLPKSSEGSRKSSENHQKRRHQHVHIIKRTVHGGLKIRILFSGGKNNILLTRCARS